MGGEVKTLQRNSNIELLRMLCIVGIIGMHILRPFFETQDILKTEFILLWNTFANTGVTIFILISGYYGIRFKWERLFSLITIIFFYSVTTHILELTLLHRPLDYKVLLSSIFPVCTKKYWFITCYIVLYALSPFINQGVEAIKQIHFKALLLTLILFFVIAPTCFISEILGDNGKGIINMLLAYLTGRYLAKYGFPEIIKKHAVSFMILCFTIIFSLNSAVSIFVKHHVFLQFARDNSAFIFLASICVFYCFLQKTFYSSFVNKLANYVFSVYIIHGFLIKVFLVRDDFFFLSFVIVIVIACVLSAFIEFLRRIALGKVFDKVVSLMISVKDKVVEKV